MLPSCWQQQRVAEVRRDQSQRDDCHYKSLIPWHELPGLIWITCNHFLVSQVIPSQSQIGLFLGGEGVLGDKLQQILKLSWSSGFKNTS